MQAARLFDLLARYVPRVAYANTPPYANRRGLDACSQSRVSSQARRPIHASFSLSQLSIALRRRVSSIRRSAASLPSGDLHRAISFLLVFGKRTFAALGHSRLRAFCV